jgi:hypothetical protein
MKTSLECIPCLLRQIVEASSFFTRDEQLRARIMREVLSSLSQQDLSQSPPHRYEKQFWTQQTRCSRPLNLPLPATPSIAGQQQGWMNMKYALK